MQYNTIKEVVQELINNKGYEDNVEDMLTTFFEHNKESFESWKNWFNRK